MKFSPGTKAICTAIAALALSSFCASAQVLTFEEAKQRADQGDPFAQAVVAFHYQVGWNTEKNSELAVKYALASAKAGNPLGQFRLGVLLCAGEGVPKDEERGLSFQAAAAEGLNRSKDPYSLTALGVLVFQGKAVAQDVPQAERYKEAARLYKLAAGGAPGDWTSGFAPAAFNYAMCAHAGHGMAKNPDDKQAYLGKASHQQYPPALKYLEEQKKKFAGSEYDEYRLPKTSPDVLKAEINPETKVWEKVSEKGSSAKWVSLTSLGAEGPLSVELRTQYQGYPVLVQAFENDFEMNSGGGNQSLRSSAQYRVTGDTDLTIQIGPTLPLEQRNLSGLTEYPVILEIKVTNDSSGPVELEGFKIDVESWTPIEKSIAGIVTQDGEVARLHNFGWGPWPDAQLSWAVVRGWPQPGDSPVVAPFGKLTGKDGTNVDVPGGNFDAYSEGGTLLVRTTVGEDGSPSGESSEVRAYYIGEGPYFSLVRLPSDVVLPSGRDNYALVYPLQARIGAKQSTSFTISLTSDVSAKVELSASFSVSGKTQKAEKKIELVLERIRPPEGAQIETVIPIGGNDSAPYSSFQGEVLKGFFFEAPEDPHKLNSDTFIVSGLFEEWGSNSARSLMSEDLSSEKLSQLREFNAKLSSSLSAVSGARHFRPIVFSSDETRLFGTLQDKAICSWDLSPDTKVHLTGSRRGSFIDGYLEIGASGASSVVTFRAPWSFDAATENLSIQLATGHGGEWLAWSASADGKTRIYLVFPKYSNLCFALPFIAEHKAKSVGVGEDGETLLIESHDGSVESVRLSSAAIRQLAVMSESGGVVSPYRTDVDALGRARLWLPSASTNKIGRPGVSLTGKAEQSAGKQPARIAWLSSLQVGIHGSAGWSVWNLADGTIRPAAQQEAETLSKNCGQIRFESADDDAQFRMAAFKAGSASFEISEQGWKFPPYQRSWEIAREAQGSGIGGLTWLRLNPYGRGIYHSRLPLFVDAPALSPNTKYLAICNQAGNEIWLVDLFGMTVAGTAIASPTNGSVFTLVTPDGDYMSGDGQADGCVLSNGTSAIPLSRMEAKFNRPDIVLDRLGADDSLIKEAKRLRERLVRRSDFKSFDGATLIDIPVVTVKTEVPEKTGDSSLTLDFEASNSTGPLKELRVFNNGALVQTVPLIGKDGQLSRESAGEVKVDLASGENRLQLMAVSEEGFTSAFAEKRLECTAEPDSRRCFIATVGVSQYNDPRFNLKFAAKDAEDMSKALAEKAQHRGYHPEVMVVKNAEVDGTLVGKLREFLSKAGTDDEVVLFFAGHGLLDKDLEYHFARHDTDFDASENMGITFQELESLVDGIKPLKRTVLFDTCHSGEVEEEDKPQLLAMVGGAVAPDAGSGVQVRGVAMRGMKVKELEPKLRHADFIELESLFPDSRRAKGANILTSSSGSEFSMESDAWQNGLFTFAFLNALKDERADANGDKAVSFTEAAAAVQDKVKTLSAGQQRPITRGVNREAEVALASFGPPVAPIPSKEKKSGLWPF